MYNVYITNKNHLISFLRKKVIPAHNTRVCFFELAEAGRITWEAYSRPEEYKAATLRFRPPKYRTLVITEPVRVLMQLLIGEDTYSEAIPFHYLPLQWFPGRMDLNSGNIKLIKL